MKVYIRNYRNRIRGLGITAAALSIALILIALVFGNKLNSLCAQLRTYEKADYSIAYVLNYRSGLDNELIYPDMDVSVYLDEEESRRMAVTSLMKSKDSAYTLSFLDEVKRLSDDQIAIPHNVADEYSLKNGDAVFLEFPYKNQLRTANVVITNSTEYDISKPLVDNRIGQVVIGYDSGYEESAKCKYLVFSNISRSDELSAKSQIINRVINKSENYEYVFKQGLFILFFELFAVVAAFIIGWNAFFSNSFLLLRRNFLKGYSKRSLVAIPVAESAVITFGNILLLERAIAVFIPPVSLLGRVYYSIPMIAALLFLIYILIHSMMRAKR